MRKQSHPYKKYREPPPPIATFGQLLCGNPKWFWIHCNNWSCHQKAALPLAPFAIRWGWDAPAVPTIRQAFRCSVCGEKISTLTAPSVSTSAGGVQAFPDELALRVLTPHAWLDPMCNLYSITSNQTSIRQLARFIKDMTGNLQPLPGVFPDYLAPIVRNNHGTRELAMARWGMPSPAFALKGRNSDPGITNVRNTASPHWRRWLGPENRCVVPFTSFSENEVMADGSRPPVWFALNEDRPLAFFAGIWTAQWKSVRKVKEGETTNDLFAFLTTDPNKEVGQIHPKAMPVILTTDEELEMWMTAPTPAALKLQRPLPNGALHIVARGEKKDSG
jgi:putative SOS response-associated peptidase YedK